MKLVFVDVDGVLVPENTDQLSLKSVSILEKFIQQHDLFPIWFSGRNFPEDIFYQQILKVLPSSEKWPIVSPTTYEYSGWWKSSDAHTWLNSSQLAYEEVWIIDDDCPQSEQKSLTAQFGVPVNIVTPDRLKGLIKKDLNRKI